MKTFLFGYSCGIATWLCWKYRAIVIPWLRTEEQKATDALLRRKDG